MELPANLALVGADNEDERAAPEITVRAPDGSRYATQQLSAPRLTVGRLPELNDLALEPDGDQLVTRKEHLAFEKRGTAWVVIDPGSVNGTYLRRGGNLTRVTGSAELRDGDVVCLLGEVTNPAAPKYWEIEFGDGGRTRPVALPDPSTHLSYDASTARLVLVKAGETHEIAIRRQTHNLVRFMAAKNAAAGSHVLCSHEELMAAVWGDEPLHSREELTRLFWELRNRLQPFEADHLVESVRGLGYRLRTTPSA